MADLLNTFAAGVGWTVLGLLGVGIFSAIVVLVLATFPVRWTWVTESRRKKKGKAGTARIDWQSPSGSFNEITAIIGPSSRGKTRWFFGLMLFGKDGHDADLRFPKIISRPPHHQPEEQP